MLSNSDACTALIKQFESCRLHSYIDQAGLWTIGWGHRTKLRDKLITQEQADDLLTIDIAKAVNTVTCLVSVPLTQNQFDALVSFAYNIGAQAFRDSTLLKLLNASHPNVADEFKRWVYVRKNGRMLISKGLVRRREAERVLFIGDVCSNSLS